MSIVKKISLNSATQSVAEVACLENTENDASKSASTIPTKKDLWEEILQESEDRKKELNDYIKAKSAPTDVIPTPTIAYLNKALFPLIHDGLIEMLTKIKEEDSFYHRKSTLNGLDFLSEFLYNKNPVYPERQANWTYIFDMDWVVYFLDRDPRPYYPFHLVWSDNFGALKIQSYMRGYWARSREDVQEVRRFWKAMEEDRLSKRSSNSTKSGSKQDVISHKNSKTLP